MTSLQKCSKLKSSEIQSFLSKNSDVWSPKSWKKMQFNPIILWLPVTIQGLGHNNKYPSLSAFSFFHQKIRFDIKLELRQFFLFMSSHSQSQESRWVLTVSTLDYHAKKKEFL